MNKRIFALDKPPRCEGCRYHDRNRNKCVLGKDNCYYLVGGDFDEESACDDCPYRRKEPCIGYCLRKCCEELFGKR